MKFFKRMTRPLSSYLYNVIKNSLTKTFEIGIYTQLKGKTISHCIGVTEIDEQQEILGV